MTNLRTYVSSITVLAFLTVGVAVAQDDLDDLLASLEEESAATEVSVAQDGDAELPEEEPAAETAVEEDVTAEDSTYGSEEEEGVEESAVEESAEESDDEEEVMAEPIEGIEEPTEGIEEPVDELVEEPKVEEPVDELEIEEAPAAEEAPTEAAAAAEPDAGDADEVLGLLAALAEETEEDEPAAAEEAPAPVVAKSADTKPVAAAKPAADDPDAELLSNIRTTERIRRKALDEQAKHMILEARAALKDGENMDAARNYAIALKLLNDSVASKPLRKECSQGIAEGLYRAAIDEYDLGRRVRAVKLMEKSRDMRHPKANGMLEKWNAVDPDKEKTDLADIKHRRNDDDYKARRQRELRHLKRARQYLAQRELDDALDECELVLVGNPYNQEAIRLRESIERKREVILKQERVATREGMIADVDEAWRPVYAVDARELENTPATTTKKELGPDPERSVEQTIIKRMKDMRLPAISFKPPATIIDAVEYFRQASKDFDRPEIPIERRGFNFVLKTPETLHTTAMSEDDADDFSADTEEESGTGGIPVIPMITASDISFYEALKLVCESVDYKFSVQGPIVMVMQKDMSTDELIVRDFPVSASFLEKMSSASEDMTSMQTSAFGNNRRKANDEEEDNQERDWKEFFGLLGVKWPEGSSIYYVKTVGKLFVKNTADNLAEFEKVLMTVSAPVQLIEIETRFVEVCQDDLNSLGFEWILNNDYSVGVDKHIAKALGLKRAGFTSAVQGTGATKYESLTPETRFVEVQNGDGTTEYTLQASATATTVDVGEAGGVWTRETKDPSLHKDHLGFNKFGGEGATYQNGNRYLSTLSNHIDGEGYSTNDQFMRVNAFLGQADVSMILHMLSQRSDTDLLSAPKVLTRPGEEAVMKVVTEYIYPTDYDVQLQSSNSSSGGYGSSSQSAILAIVEPQSFTMREVGVILQVTPTLTDDGNVVDLELNTQVVDEPTWKNYGMRIPFTGNSSLQSFEGIGEIFDGLASIFDSIGRDVPQAMKNALAASASESAMSAMDNLTNGDDNMTYYDAPMEQPFFHVRSIDSKVSVYPGATIVMGGLITEARKAMDDKVPYLGDIPFIGRLFRSHAEETSKRNLLIFVTTRIVDGRGREIPREDFANGETSDVKAAPTADAE